MQIVFIVLGLYLDTVTMQFGFGVCQLSKDLTILLLL